MRRYSLFLYPFLSEIEKSGGVWLSTWLKILLAVKAVAIVISQIWAAVHG